MIIVNMAAAMFEAGNVLKFLKTQTLSRFSLGLDACDPIPDKFLITKVEKSKVKKIYKA